MLTGHQLFDTFNEITKLVYYILITLLHSLHYALFELLLFGNLEEDLPI